MSTGEKKTIVLFNTTLALENVHHVLLLKELINQQANSIQMSLLNQTKLLTATSELAHNILKYSGAGQALVEVVSRHMDTGIRITFTDRGPGIADIALVMQDGYSTGNTLGIGLPGAKRLVNEFSITSEVNKGTTVIITKWANG